MIFSFRVLMFSILLGLPVIPASAAEKDIFDFAAQKAAPKSMKKIVFVADTAPHGGRGNHEFLAAAILLARTINADYSETAYCAVHTKNHWPTDLSYADAIIVLLNDGGSAVNPAVETAVGRGAGFMGIHYAVEVSKGKNGDAFLKWMGGYFETHWSVNPTWTASITSLPDHPVARGVKPFTIKDEWYYHMRFVPGMVGITPILAAVPPQSSLREDPQRGTNPTVAAEVAAGKPQVLAWAYERPHNGGRGFGFTGMHYHANLANDNLRTVLLNAVAWTAGLEVPEGGVPSKTPSPKELDQLIDEGKKAVREYGI